MQRRRERLELRAWLRGQPERVQQLLQVSEQWQELRAAWELARAPRAPVWVARVRRLIGRESAREQVRVWPRLAWKKVLAEPAESTRPAQEACRVWAAPACWAVSRRRWGEVSAED